MKDIFGGVALCLIASAVPGIILMAILDCFPAITYSLAGVLDAISDRIRGDGNGKEPRP